MRSILINRLYPLRVLLILIATFMALSFALSLPSISEAAPQVINALAQERGAWRNYYRDKFFADIHSSDLMESLNTYVTEDPLIKKAIRLRIAGEWKESIDSLSGLTADPEVHNQDEVAYVLGLIYESLAFFPEAMGNYDRLEFKKGEDQGPFYYKTILRKSYVKFITGLNYSKLLSMVDADGGFYKVFKNSTDEVDWKDALAGHGVMLYFFGAHESAEEVFQKVKKYGVLKPAVLFAQAENYMNMGLHQEARVAFQDLLHMFEESERDDILSYIYLRLGDIANIRDEKDSALAFYKLVIPVLKEGEKPTFNDPYIIQAMAVGEYYMKNEKNDQAIKVFYLLSTGPMPIGLDLKESIALNIVLLYHKGDLELKTFEYAKEFLLLYPNNPYIEQVKTIINDTIYKFIAVGYEGYDFNNVLYYYFENVRFIYEKRTLMIVGDVFLELRFPEQANSVFLVLWHRFKDKDYSDIELVTGLALSETMLGNFKEASALLRRAKPAGRPAKEKLAFAWRRLGDDYFRKGDKKGALYAYSRARGTLFDLTVELRYGALLTGANRSKEAITVYSSLLKRSITDDNRAIAYMGAARTYVSVRNWRKALINYQFALKFAQRRILGEIHYKIGEVNYSMGRNNKALKAWKLAESIDEQGYYKRLAKGRIKEVRIWDQALM